MLFLPRETRPQTKKQLSLVLVEPILEDLVERRGELIKGVAVVGALHAAAETEQQVELRPLGDAAL